MLFCVRPPENTIKEILIGNSKRACVCVRIVRIVVCVCRFQRKNCFVLRKDDGKGLEGGEL